MIQYFDWLPQLENLSNADSIENELVICRYSEVISELLADMPFHSDTMDNPHKFDFFMFVKHMAGSAVVKIDMTEFALENPCNLIILAPGQIVSIDKISPDFDADIILMSKRFVEGLMVFVNGRVPFRLNNPQGFAVEHFDENEVASDIIFKAVRNILKDKENPYRLQVVQHILMALFYSSERVRNVEPEAAARTNADVITKEFLSIVKENFRKERQLKFYSDVLCITPRYLSRVVKECTGASAAEWIERAVVLEARALLKSTNMTVQQISDELNFPSQTFFGKYFKRRVGMSPKEYRRLG
jgi:AraC-like DNA-binding protein